MKTQLRIRTEYSFGEVFGPLDRVIAALREQGCESAGMVEFKGGTWGHVQWEKQCTAAGIRPMFGAEFYVPEEKYFPSCWVLAADIAAFYKLSSACHENKVSSGRGQRSAPTITLNQLFEAKDKVIRFAGSALADPELFDYIDINPASVLQQQRALRLHKHTKKPLVITSDNWYPRADDLDRFLLVGSIQKPTPQHILSYGDLANVFPELSQKQIGRALAIADEIAERLWAKEVKLRKAPLIQAEGDLAKLCKAGIRKRLASRQIETWTDQYQSRLNRELKMIREKKFESYFLVVSDLVRWAKQSMLVGPGRGSSAGSLVCYLIEITEIDPIPHGLLFERFIDVTRSDLPDIDLDFPDVDRERVITYLIEKYGKENVAHIGTILTYKAISALNEIQKQLAIPKEDVEGVRNAMFKRVIGDERVDKCLQDTLRDTEVGKELLAKYPAFELADAIEGHASHTGMHAGGIVVCNEPISHFCTVEEGVAQVDKYDAEPLNLLKIDVLGLRTLGILQDANCLSIDAFYSLKFDDDEVFKVFRDGRYQGIFQWEGRALQTITDRIYLDRFTDLEQITALARPGPLGAGTPDDWVRYRLGRFKPEPKHIYLEDTFGLVVYQEQVMRLCRDVAGMDWDTISLIRKAMSKSLGDSYFKKFSDQFVSGAVKHGIGKEEAAGLWNSIAAMASYAFNKSHSTAYSAISYWTAYMKRYHTLEYAAAALRGAKDDETATQMLRELHQDGIAYVPFDIERSQANWSVVDDTLLGGFVNIKGIGPAKSRTYLDKRAAGKLTEKDREKILSMPLRFGDLFPLHTAHREAFENPKKWCALEGEKVRLLKDVGGTETVVVIVKVVGKKLGDYNEPQRVERRKGERIEGESHFVDLQVVDDSIVQPMIVRIAKEGYTKFGPTLYENVRPNFEVMMIRGKKIRGFPMLQFLDGQSLTTPRML